MSSQYQILLYYNYTFIENPQEVMEEQEALRKKLNLLGRIIIAKEGINGTVEGKVEDTEKYIEEMKKSKYFADTHFKTSEGTGKAFDALWIRVREEILSTGFGEENFHPKEISGKYISPDELQELYEKGEEFYVIDMRNDYEHRVGYFDGSIKMPFETFRDLPNKVDIIDHLKDKKVVTVCTGGIKCEKASGFLLKKGFKDVYQLHGGIHSYIQKYPNKKFKGKLYVFDGRVMMAYDTDSPEHEVVSNCDKCGSKSDNYVDCHYIHCKGNRHFICCENCLDENKFAFCSNICKEKHYNHELTSRVATAIELGHRKPIV